MVDLKANTPCEGLSVVRGTCSLSTVPFNTVTLISPYKGKEKQLSEALFKAHGMRLAAPNRSTGKAVARCVWFGHGQVVLIGPKPDKALAKFAAIVDQSDSWVTLRLQGGGAVDALARLTSIDLRAAVFKRGHTARSELRHMMVSITRVGADAFEIMAFRSMAATLAHDLQEAMDSVAARG